MNAMKLKNVTKTYSNFKLGPINLNIPSGTIVGLIGENGAGKTTLLKSILNIIKIENGSIQIFNKDYQKDENAIKEDIGIVLDNMFFPELLTAKDIDCVMKDIYQKWDSSLYQKYLMDFKIPMNKQIKTLSKGTRKKLEIITSLAHHPKLLLLDEPTSGLDPIVRNEVLDLFLDFLQDEEHTILLSTHITSDLEHIADYIVFINKGNIILEEEKDILLENYGVLKCDIDKFKEIDKQDIIRYKKTKYSYEILIKNREKLKKKYKGFVIDKVTIEDIMILFVKGSEIA